MEFNSITMVLNEEVKKHLTEIKRVKGVENCVLTQRDGNPIQSAGVWLSQDEMFRVCAATSAIYNCALELHGDRLKQILIEGQRAKILLVPLRNSDNKAINRIIEAQGLQSGDDEFYIAISAQPGINLGGIFLKVRRSLIEIKKALIMSGECFKPPLRQFSEEDLQGMYESMNLKENIEEQQIITSHSTALSNETSRKLFNLLSSYSAKIVDLKRAYLTMEGGFVVDSVIKKDPISANRIDAEATMTYSLFSTSDQCAWFLKKMRVTTVLLECVDEFQFVFRVKNGIFSSLISKGVQRLGLLRMVIPNYIKALEKIMEENQGPENEIKLLDVKALFSELVMS